MPWISADSELQLYATLSWPIEQQDYLLFFIELNNSLHFAACNLSMEESRPLASLTETRQQHNSGNLIVQTC